MRLRKNMKRTAAAVLALSMAVSAVAAPASAAYICDVSKGDVVVSVDKSGNKTIKVGDDSVTIKTDGTKETTGNGIKEDGDGTDDIIITGDNTGDNTKPTESLNAEEENTSEAEKSGENASEVEKSGENSDEVEKTGENTGEAEEPGSLELLAPEDEEKQAQEKETEEKLSKAIVDANAAYKTQAEFLANMSHEIRTPINGILGMLQLTLMAEDLQADYRDNLITAKNCADTLLRLINDILDISKLEAGKYKIKEERFDIRTAIEDTVAAQVPIATNKGLQLDCSFGSNIPKLVRGDGQRIQQVLNCLLSNAIKFTSEGSVRVKIASMDDGDNKIKIRMAVADTGIGISEANMSKLFIRFSQVDASDTRKYGGSGLGLVITKQIVELMGGNITVQSKEDIGSTFIVEIPLKVIKAADAADEFLKEKEEPAVFSINAHSKARILVAEDEPVNQQVIGKLLGMAGFSYDIAENGQKAVELFKTKIYDAALFDVQMPVMDGIAATQEIREIERKEKRKRLPIIAVTARAMFGDKERILENQLDDYIAKPYNLNDVVDTLNKYIDD